MSDASETAKMQLGCSSITWGGLTADARGITGVAEARYRIAGDLSQALHDIGAAGYTGVEVFDGDLADIGSGVVRAELDGAGLALAGVYAGANFVYPDALPDELERIRRTIGQARAAGAGQLVVGGGAVRAAASMSPDDLARLAQGLDEVAELAEAEGLVASFHPHLGTIAQSPEQITEVMDRARIGLCVDTAHIAAGGGDPADLIRRYAARLRHVHLKDLRAGSFAPLGAGELDFDDVLGAVAETGYDGWLVVELDDYTGEPARAAQANKRFLDGVLSRTGPAGRVAPVRVARAAT